MMSVAGQDGDDRALAGRLLDCLRAEHAALARNDAEAIRHLAQEKLDCFRRLETGVTRAPSPELLDCLRACREQNLVNGALIEQLRRNARQALAVLRGTVDEPALYGPAGDRPALPGGRSLATA